MELSIFSQINCSHSTFAEQRKNLVVGHGLTGLEFGAINQHLRRRLISGSVNKVTGFFMRLERSEEHTSELQSRSDLVCRLLLEKKKKKNTTTITIEQKKNIYTTKLSNNVIEQIASTNALDTSTRKRRKN